MLSDAISSKNNALRVDMSSFEPPVCLGVRVNLNLVISVFVSVYVVCRDTYYHLNQISQFINDGQRHLRVFKRLFPSRKS